MEILPQLLLNALIAGSIYALASSGLSLTFGLLRILNFAHGHLMMAGAYAFYFAYITNGCSLLIATVFTIFVTVILSWLSLQIFVLPFLKYSLFLPFVTTLALSTILESAVSMLFGVNVKSLTTGLEISSIEFWGMYITPTQIVIIVSALVVLFVLGYVTHLTGFGRKIRALSEHEQAAQTIGVSDWRINFLVFTAGTLLAAFSGVLVGFETNLQPTMGNAYTIKAFAAMILGGLGNIWGTIAGAYILGLIENLSIGLDFWGYSLPAGYKDAFAFVIILGILLFRPQGLFKAASRAA
jgi:branched-chain amino acid transport system permease protein